MLGSVLVLFTINETAYGSQYNFHNLKVVANDVIIYFMALHVLMPFKGSIPNRGLEYHGLVDSQRENPR